MALIVQRAPVVFTLSSFE